MKRIVDIFPKEQKEPSTAFQGLKYREITKAKTGESEKAVSSKKGLILVFPLLIPVFLFCYFSLSKAKIEIWPVTEILALETKVTCDKTAEKTDLSNKIIPGEVLETEKLITEEFSSSGVVQKEKKAEGVIRIYNNYSASVQVLVANTRFVSADGKLFKSIEKVTVPGEKYEGGKLVPGYLDIKVAASQPGPEYNIGPSTFSIPGFAGTDRYTKIYGKSFQDMTGGMKEEIAQVIQEDLDSAKKALTDRALKESEASLKEKIPPEYILLEEAVSSEILETFSLAKPKDELEKFKFQVKARSVALVFKKEDLEKFAREFILSQISETKNFSETSLKFDYSPEIINLKTGKITLLLKIDSKIYSDIDRNNLKEALLGKSSAETKIFLENQPQIAKVEIKFWPFPWVKNVPKNAEKIEIQLRVD